MGFNDGSYRKKIKDRGVAFHTKEQKSYRIPEFFKGYEFKVRPTEYYDAEEIQEELQMRRMQRERERQRRALDRSINQSINSSYNYEYYGSPRQIGYYGMSTKKPIQVPSRPMKKGLSIRKLGEYNYTDIKGLEEEFDPTELIDENDREDDIYLAEYNIQHDLALQKQKRGAQKARFGDNGRKYQNPTMGTSRTPAPVYTMKKSRSVDTLGHLSPKQMVSTRELTQNFGMPNYGYKRNLQLAPIEVETRIPYLEPLQTGRGPSTTRFDYTKNGALARAGQLERDAYRREQELANNLYMQHDRRIQRSLERYARY